MPVRHWVWRWRRPQSYRSHRQTTPSRRAARPHISPYLPISHHISPHLPISPHISPYLTISHHISPYLEPRALVRPRTDWLTTFESGAVCRLLTRSFTTRGLPIGRLLVIQLTNWFIPYSRLMTGRRAAPCRRSGRRCWSSTCGTRWAASPPLAACRPASCLDARVFSLRHRRPRRRILVLQLSLERTRIQLHSAVFGRIHCPRPPSYSRGAPTTLHRTVLPHRGLRVHHGSPR